MSDYGYVFVLSRVDVNAELPFEVIPGHFFRRADDKEIAQIKQLIKQVRPVNIASYPYERTGQQKLPGEKEGHFIIHTEELPEAEWAYWVISFTGYNDKIEDLRYACSLLRNDIELGFFVYHHTEVESLSLSFGGHSEFSYFSKHNFGTAPSSTITTKELQEIGQNYELIINLDDRYSHVIRALKWFSDLQKLRRDSDFLVVGLFTVIESLVTHNPSDTDVSLSHQLCTKIPLLKSHLKWDLDYSQYFDEANEDTYWKKLYSYRSNIVHNGKSEIEGNSQILKSKENVIECLRNTVKLLLLLALAEPQFLVDLKKC